MFTMKNKWILFSYSIPANNAKARMRIWRRISGSGAVQLKTGLQILPNRDDLRETLTWLIGEVNALGGDAITIQCVRVEGMEDGQIEKLFQNQIDPVF
jgi:DNA-binding transcriptional regulator PaaX